MSLGMIYWSISPIIHTHPLSLIQPDKRQPLRPSGFINAAIYARLVSPKDHGCALFSLELTQLEYEIKMKIVKIQWF